MAEEIQEAVQIIRVAYDGIELAMKLGGGGLELMQKGAELLIGMLDYEKSMGKTSMRKLLLKGGDLQVLQFDTKDLRKVEKAARKYGVLYSVLPDINPKDGLSEIIFHTEAVPRVNNMLHRLDFGRITTFDDYLEKGDQKKLTGLLEYLQGQKKGNEKLRTEEGVRAGQFMEGMIEKVGLLAMEKKTISVETVREEFPVDNIQADMLIKRLEVMGVLSTPDEKGEHTVLMDQEAFMNRIRGYQDLAERMRAITAAKDLSLMDITISKTLIAKENDQSVKTRVPGTYGKRARYLWIDKKDIMEIHDGKTLLTFLDKNKRYELFDGKDRIIETKTGEDLSGHYDLVGEEVRKRYQRDRRKEHAKGPDRTGPGRKRKER